MSTALNRYFSVWEGLFSNWMIRKHYFKAHLVQKQAKRKIPTFDQNLGLIPSEKSSLVTLKIQYFLYFRRACFLTWWSSNIISKFILCKNKQRGSLQLLTKIIGFPLEKSHYAWRLCKIHIFFGLERLVFLLDGEQTLEEKSIFWPKSWVNPFEKNTVWWQYKIHVLIV